MRHNRAFVIVTVIRRVFRIWPEVRPYQASYRVEPPGRRGVSHLLWLRKLEVRGRIGGDQDLADLANFGELRKGEAIVAVLVAKRHPPGAGVTPHRLNQAKLRDATLLTAGARPR